MPNHLLLTRMAILVAATVLASCGGGGSGSTSTPVTPPPAPPPPAQTLVLTTVNGSDAALIAVSLTEGLLQIADVINAAVDDVLDANTHQFEKFCMQGGLIEFDVSDVDQDNRLSQNDSIRVTYRDCELPQVGGDLTGDLFLTISSVVATNSGGEIQYAGIADASALTLPSGPVTTSRLDKSVSFSYTKDRLSESTLIAGSVGVNVVNGANSVTESLKEFEISKVFDFTTARYVIRTKGLVDSELLGGSFTIDENSELSGFFNAYPERGSVILRGRDDTTASASTTVFIGASSVEITLNEPGSGNEIPIETLPWVRLAAGYLWWYETTRPSGPFTDWYLSDDFSLLYYAPDGAPVTGVNPDLRIQFSRPVDPSTVPAALTTSRLPDGSDDVLPVELDIEILGAAVFLRPREQLMHGERYFYPDQSFSVDNGSRNVALIAGAEFTTANSLISRPTASTVVGLPGTRIELDGQSSVSVDGEIASYAWRQTEGPVGQLSGQQLASATFTMPTVAAPDLVSIELEVTNEDGEQDRQSLSLAAFQSPAAVNSLSFESEDVVSGDFETGWVLTPANGSFTATQLTGNSVSIRHESADIRPVVWTLDVAADDGAELAVGSYENATRYRSGNTSDPLLHLRSSSRTCANITGRFDVLEISFDPDGVISTAAIDFDQSCDGGTTWTYGSMRLGSTLPTR